MRKDRTLIPRICFGFALIICFLTGAASAQVSAPQATIAQPGDASAALLDVSNKLEQEAHAASLDLAKLRPEKWKADSQYKQQSQASADSISRNLTSALPTLIAAVRAAPGDITPALKLFRDLVALSDAFKSLAESAGAFGPKQDFDAISQHAAAIDSYKTSLADSLENMASQKDAELARLRSTSRPAPSVLPKKIIVDDTQPVKKKSTKGKTAAKKPQTD